jgi:hypothetical protein
MICFIYVFPQTAVTPELLELAKELSFLQAAVTSYVDLFLCPLPDCHDSRVAGAADL